MPETLAHNIKAFIEDRFQTKRDTLDKEYEKERAKAVSSESADDVEAQYATKREKLTQDFTLSNWLDSAAKRAAQISMVTHAVKFTHSSAKGTNILASDLGHDVRYLDTASLPFPAVDAVGNAAALDVARLLQLTDDNGQSLLEYLKRDDITPLKDLTHSDTQLSEWASGLKQALQDATPSSHSLSKQVYFPIGNAEYHLLAPLFSSSLSQALYQEVTHSRFSQDMVAAREARKKQRYHDKPVVAYPNLALTIAGGSKPQNVSQLNSGRGGRNYLFSTRPPQWQAQLKAPVMSGNIFTHPEVRYATRMPIKQLTAFLIKVNQQHADSNVRIRNRVSQLVDETVDHIISKVAQWQQLPTGWSNNATELPLAQRRWLDPNHPQWDVHDDQWQQEIATMFGQWIVASVNHIANNELSLGAIEVTQWQDAFKQALQEIS
ncbi:hypothetical protein ABT56_17645 [Photobacterium aquae]|uniref:CRISPR-associated protein Csy1 n=1 Tax=Photobacterium aquae TaxID=1195763 RepID=A0A0J1JNJ0_9GAMM|nr:type I-F CRISPR-associated protein Csy1 [Photobacterium aquae]KLV03797.1 hypothetical protein ABT56_17645 [Photobacterium aquae]